METIYKLQWWDGNGGTYIRSFDTEEERAAFISRIARKTIRGAWNYTTWENEIIKENNA